MPAGLGRAVRRRPTPAPTATPATDAGRATVSDGRLRERGTTAAPKPPPVAYATIMLDGKPQQLRSKQTFPKGDPMFVLVALKKKQAKIGVAGGAFDDGKTRHPRPGARR